MGPGLQCQYLAGNRRVVTKLDEWIAQVKGPDPNAEVVVCQDHIALDSHYNR